MIKIILASLLITTCNHLFAQYLHYSDNSNKNKSIQPAKPVEDSVVYHKWPDRCPGMTGSIPVLTSYVPKEIVLKLTEIFKGHLYSISPEKIENNKLQYKLKVCADGEIKFEYANELGSLITK